jgi:hypothetical protein
MDETMRDKFFKRFLNEQIKETFDFHMRGNQAIILVHLNNIIITMNRERIVRDAKNYFNVQLFVFYNEGLGHVFFKSFIKNKDIDFIIDDWGKPQLQGLLPLN